MITFNAPINFVSYGIVGKNILKSLSKLDDVALFPIGDINGLENVDEKTTVLKALNNSLLHDISSPCIKLWHQHDLYSMPQCSKRIGFPIFELNKFNNREKSSLSSCDELFVCSEWAKSICESELYTPTKVVPLGVDTSIFYPKSTPNSDVFTILNVSKIEIRKGHDLIPEIIKLAFPDGNENYRLIMSWNNPFMTGAEISEWERFYRKSIKNVEFPGRLPTEQMVDMLCNAHVMLSPSRAEGWNLSLLEAMACGTFVITTNYSGHTEFCKHGGADLIDIDGMETAEDGKWFTSGIGEWAIPNIKHAADILRKRYEEWKKYGSHVGRNDIGINIAQQFSWDNTAKKILEYIN